MIEILEDTPTTPELDLGGSGSPGGSELVPDELPWWLAMMESPADLLH